MAANYYNRFSSAVHWARWQHPHPPFRQTVKTKGKTGKLRVHSASHLASPPHLHRALLWFACLVRPGVPASADEDGHIDAPTPSFIRPGRDAPLLPVLPFLLLPFPPWRFLSTFFHPSSVSPWRGAGPVAAADGAGCAGSASMPACIECMRVGVG